MRIGSFRELASRAARRSSPLRRLFAGGLVLVSLATVAACDQADAASVAPAPKRGGTLFVNVQGGLDLLDPQRTYSASEMNVLRLTTRTLTTYKAVAGNSASEVVPDLATDNGRPSENNTVWRFTLKPGVKWENGEPVVCSQVKYGIERYFASIFNREGAPYPEKYLRPNPTPYEGPYLATNNDGKGLESITCTDERNIVFKLAVPVGDFGYTVALSTFAPVLPEKDTKEDYAKHPYSNGPYKLDGSLTKDGLTLVRNKFWSDANDQVRKAYPDKIVFNFQPDNSGVVTNEIIEDQGDARNTVMLDGDVAPNFLQQVVNDSELMSRAITGTTPATRFMAINTRVVPDLACRQALIYAFNKRKWRAVNGGSVLGDYATTMIPPGFNGYKNFDLYGSMANPEGAPAKAIELMNQQKQAGKPCDTTIRVAYRDTAIYRRLIKTVVEAYQLAGIRVEPVPIADDYYGTGIGDPTNNYHMMVAGWIPDWASGSTVIQPLFDGREIEKTIDPTTGKGRGNVNWPLLNDPKINEQIDAALAEASLERQAVLWGDLDQQIQRLAVDIPILYEKGIKLAGSNVLGGFIHPAFGMPDLCALGLAQV